MREDRIIQIQPHAESALPLPSFKPGAMGSETGLSPSDRLGRPLQDLRISVTDRCNFRCGYCMPRAVYGPGHKFLPQPELLSFEEITRTARMFLGLGVTKLRITGGEPLMRRDLVELIRQLAALRTPQGHSPELAMTTNGALLAAHAQALRDAGLQRVTVSLDALSPDTFRTMSDSDIAVERVLEGIAAAQQAGLSPVKVNMVVQKGVNDDQILPMVAHFRGSGAELRFIEFMDVGQTNNWNLDRVLPSQAVQDLIATRHALRELPADRPGDTARRMALADGSATLGFVSSVTQAFCGDCSRLRLSTDGKLYTCLFGARGHDLRSLLRNGTPDADIQQRLRTLWQQRSDQYSALRHRHTTGSAPRVEMSYIGG
jgi:GTP 3',8-cyclase